MGGKHKLLPQIIPLFPDNIETFVDLFGGGGNVAVNIKANKIIYNDIITQVVDMLKCFKDNNLEYLLQEIDTYINTYDLSKTNQAGFLELRNIYNKDKNNSMALYTIISYAFNNQIRFNSSGGYNMPFGKNRSSFNPTLRNKFIEFVNELHDKNIVFINKDFRDLKIDKLTESDFVYCDPPYWNTTATYNENDGWGVTDESALLELLIKLNNKGVKWALSNNVAVNYNLEEWARENNFHIHYLNHTYNNSNYHKKDKEAEDIEVLVTNY